ncbi:EAL domain-containing protein [Alkalinema pantanalense CENA528]|uniref:EAL domain-containing protein n=1 Tax=Alkalinema pantanalense TaxID=1620705 RepID=UPI003D6E89FC
MATSLQQLSHLVSEAGQQASRGVITAISPESPQFFSEFLKAQSLSDLTRLVRHSWFVSLLSQQRLFFHYQPIFRLRSGQIVAYECLARGTTDDGQELSGQQLIDAAKATQLTHEFDHLAREVCLQSLALLLQASAHLQQQQFFINVVPNAIAENPAILEQHLQQVMDLGIQPQQIVFELTEIEAVRAKSHVAQAIQRIRDWGCQLAIDDLGSDVALNHYCLEFRPDILKLDRAMVDGCSRHPVKQVLLKSMVQAAHDMGIQILAEGIEHREDLHFCQEIDVDLAQGFALARPKILLPQEPSRAAETRLADWAGHCPLDPLEPLRFRAIDIELTECPDRF